MLKTDQPLCASDPEMWFKVGSIQAQAVAICRKCPLQRECLTQGLNGREMYGVWGGSTEDERRGLFYGGVIRTRDGKTWHRCFMCRARNSYEPVGEPFHIGIGPWENQKIQCVECGFSWDAPLRAAARLHRMRTEMLEGTNRTKDNTFGQTKPKRGIQL